MRFTFLYRATRVLMGAALSMFIVASNGAAAGTSGPAAGVTVTDPAAVAAALADGPDIVEGAEFFVRWQAELDQAADVASAAQQLAERDAVPWVVLVLRSPSPLSSHLEELGQELGLAAGLAEQMPAGSRFEVDWQPRAVEPGGPLPLEYPFLVKRAATAITGANRDAQVVIGRLDPDPELLRGLFDEGIGAYVDAVMLAPGSGDQALRAMQLIQELSPGCGTALVTEARASLESVAELVRLGGQGLRPVFFELGADGTAGIAPLVRTVNELAGEVSFDSHLEVTGAAGAWPFVRAEDLGLRLLVQTTPGQDEVEFVVGDRALRGPVRVDLASGEEDDDIYHVRDRDGLTIRLRHPRPVELLRLERMSAAELEGFEGKLTVTDERTMPVEEILRRLQTFEAAQERKLGHYEAVNTTHLRFRTASTTGGVEVTFLGAFFFDRGKGFDWAWQEVYLNGVKWRGERIPEVPLVQPDKAAALPLVINFTKEYAYTLRGTGQEEGRDCWIVDFEPVDPEPGSALFQGRVWIDRELFARVKSRAFQVGLEGDVTSNEETTYWVPVDANGAPAEWSEQAYFLPTRMVGQSTQSILDANLLVEKEVLLTDLRLNSDDFDDRRQAMHASEVTMVRDTDEGLKYLVKVDDSGTREVKEGFDTDHFFLGGGVYYDESLDYPLPLAGVDYFSLDFRGTGAQVNLFFAGLFVAANMSKPDIFGSGWDAGVRANGLLIPLGEELYRDGERVDDEEVEHAYTSLGLHLGRQLGSFFRLGLDYELGFERFETSDKADETFVLPTDTLVHELETELEFQRGGYSFALSGSVSRRADWEYWGLPGYSEYDPDHEEYTRWRATLGKTWWMPHFTNLGVELEYLGGDNLDRFSRYGFGPFAESQVRGYPRGLVTASEAMGVHLNYGISLGEVIQVGVAGDAVWATDEATGLDNELLAGVGIGGTLIGPWESIINFGIGVPVAGPADSFTARVVFLKRFW